MDPGYGSSQILEWRDLTNFPKVFRVGAAIVAEHERCTFLTS